MSERRWTDHSHTLGTGWQSACWAYEDDEGTLVLVSQIRGPKWSIQVRRREDNDERAIEFTGTEEEAKGFALHLLAWYEKSADTELEKLLGVVGEVADASSGREAERLLVELVEAYDAYQASREGR